MIFIVTSPSVTSVFYGVEDDPPPDGNPCRISGVDLPFLTEGYIRLMCIPTTKTIIFEGAVIIEFPHIFKDYPDLITVSAELCNVEDIYEDSFDGAHELRFLFLSNNNIKILRSHSFSPATKLYKLEIRNSNLKTLQANAFSNLAQLVHLELSDNLINELPLGIFESLTALRTLVLSNNAITHIDSKLLMHNPLLSFVYLDANNIAEVDTDSFEKNSVKWLNLADNPGLGTLHLSWEILDRLTMLRVSNTGLQSIFIPPNAVTVLADNNEIDTVVEAEPQKPNKLARLSLAQNKMRNMDSLFAFTQLEMLDLSDNQLDSLDAAQLHFMPNLRQLAVPRNPIKTAVNVEALKRRFPVLKSILLSENKWSIAYFDQLIDELHAHNITVETDPNFRPRLVPWPTPESGAFDPKEFELYIKELHTNYTNFENRLKMMQKEYNRQSQVIKNTVDRINIKEEDIKYVQNWLYWLMVLTTIAFITMTSVYCEFSDLKRWFLKCLPSPPAQPQSERDAQHATSRQSLMQRN